MGRKRGQATRVAWRAALPPVNKIRHPFPGRERKHLDDSAGSGRHGSRIFVTHKCRQVAYPHADVTVDDTSEHEHAATDNTVVRDEKPAELLGEVVERGLEVKNTVEGLRIFGDAADNSLTFPSTVVKLSTTAPALALVRPNISISVSFSRSWIGPLPRPLPAEVRPVAERPPPLAGARSERVAGVTRLPPPRMAVFVAAVRL